MAGFAPPNSELLKRLQGALPLDRILARPIDRLARASDASMYRIVPEVVVRPRDESDVRKILDDNLALMASTGFRGTPGIVVRGPNGILKKYNGMPRGAQLGEVLGPR